MEGYTFTILIPLILFFTFLLIGLAGGKLKPIVSGIAGVISLSAVTVISYITAYDYFFVNGKVDGVFGKIIVYNAEWLRFSDTLFIKMGILLDPISVMMLVVISTVSLMVHIYSLGYMHNEGGFSRYYSFLSLFTFAMMGLVISTNIFQTYIFWELVGVSSYLLIGFYYNRPSAVAAAKKAFIVTRFADLGFLIGILMLSSLAGTFDFIELTNVNGTAIHAGSSVLFMGLSSMTWALILVFMGCAGKSAMFPLHIWLPDAMEGPTPVSALIHAATMVVAGVYLVARLFPLYALSAPVALEMIAYVGAFTSLFAAIIACTQTDIKRVLAFSTISQIGAMMIGLGVSGYGGDSGLGFSASMFHLFTHAMFKALLFLAAGAVIHAVHTNEIWGMGGLRKYLPVTHITFLVGCLALSGIPPFSGFFSKDEILVALRDRNEILFYILTPLSGLSAFYMFRLYFGIFWNKNTNYEHTPHEAGVSMKMSLVILAILSAVTGFIPFTEFVTSDGIPFATHIHWNVAIPATISGIIGIAIAYVFYKKENTISDKTVVSLGGVYRTIHKKFYIDEIYIFVTKNIIFNMVSTPVAWFDRHVVDGIMNGIAFVTNFVSEKIKRFQSGQLQQYAFVMVTGMIIIIALIFYFLKN